jgi:uncharacterized membrane protein YecN with MAPEG domain
MYLSACCARWYTMETAGQDAVQLEVLEGQLTWLVHIIGAVIRGRLSSSTAESQETIDGDLTARAFGLLQIVDSGYAAHAIDIAGLLIAYVTAYLACLLTTSAYLLTAF